MSLKALASRLSVGVQVTTEPLAQSTSEKAQPMSSEGQAWLWPQARASCHVLWGLIRARLNRSHIPGGRAQFSRRKSIPQTRLSGALPLTGHRSCSDLFSPSGRCHQA